MNLKFGVQIPTDVEDAYQFDKKNQNNLWTKALEKKENESSDLFGLCGRISKDYFVESDYENQQMLHEVGY